MAGTPNNSLLNVSGRRIFICAGEPSGDLHGANLIRSVKRLRPEVEFVGYGGERMEAAGCELLYPLCQLAVMGFWRVLAHLPTFCDVISRADRWFCRHKPDAVVLIDFPGLNWWLARRAHYHGIPVVYFVPPQIWAWATWRVKKMQRWVDHVLCTLPFEETWYQERGVNAHFIGHPYFDEVRQQQLDVAFIRAQQDRGGPMVALLPGSRTQEVKLNFKTMIRSAVRLQRQIPQVRFLVACFKDAHRELVLQKLGNLSLPIEVHVGRTAEIIHLAEACVAVSGSVSLELLYHTKPTVVVYKVSSFNMQLARRLLASKYITLVNLLANEELFPEFLTDQCQSRVIAAQLQRWLTDEASRDALCIKLRSLRDRIGQPGACERAADYLLEILGLESPVKSQRAA
jgi:lipid-A-disaccharide synthase